MPFDQTYYDDIAADWIVSQKLDTEWYDKAAEQDYRTRNGFDEFKDEDWR